MSETYQIFIYLNLFIVICGGVFAKLLTVFTRISSSLRLIIFVFLLGSRFYMLTT